MYITYFYFLSIHFLQGNLFAKFQKRDFKKDVDVFVGTMKDEGTYWLPYYVASKDTGFKFNHTISADDPANAAFTTKLVSNLSLN